MLLLIAAFFLFCYIFSRLTCGIAKTPRCLIGKTAIVTGGNAGIGYEVCLDLASRGCRVIIADKNDSSATKEKIINRTRNTNILSKHLNLASFKSIREFAKEINATEEKIDILINNAGIGGSSIELTEDGLNPVLQVNHFGPFLLTHLLLDLLKASKSGRIIFTSSCLAFYGDLKSGHFPSTNKSNTILPALRFYSDSKLATIMVSDIFAEKLKDFGITSNSVHPGVIGTNIYNTIEDKATVHTIALNFILYTFGKSTWEGAQTTVLVAVSEETESITGKYFWDCRSFMKPRQANKLEICRKIWAITEESVKLKPEEKI